MKEYGRDIRWFGKEMSRWKDRGEALKLAKIDWTDDSRMRRPRSCDC